MAKKSFKRLGIFFTIFIIAIFWQKYSSIYKGVETEEKAEEITFLVKSGENLEEIAENLEEKGLISSSGSFYWYTRFKGMDREVVSGAFTLNTAMNTPEILAELTDQSKGQIILTIPEGWTVKEIDTKLVELGLSTEGQFIAAVKNFQNWSDYPFLDQNTLQNLELPLEGYLFPDTYFINGGDFSPEILISMTLNNFGNKLPNDTFHDYTTHEIVTMASILEKEVLGSKDKSLVAGILWKRLESDWTLGADATLLYEKDNRDITSADLASDSPYNTRKNLGLPPGPIGNPGLESLNATLNPQSSEYWFYLTTLDTGEVIYSRTNEEHNLNREKHL